VYWADRESCESCPFAEIDDNKPCKCLISEKVTTDFENADYELPQPIHPFCPMWESDLVVRLNVKN
jgi:hypothetical protein